MRYALFICGMLAGVGGVWGFSWANNALTSVSAAKADQQTAEEMDALRAESDLLRALAKDHIAGMPTQDAQQLLERLGIFDFAKGNTALVASFPDRPGGQITLVIAENAVIDINNYCWRTGGPACADSE